MWSKLKSVYEQKSETSVHFLQQKFFAFEKDTSESIATYVSKLQELSQQLADLGEKVSDKMLMTKILMSLPPSLNHFHSAWQATEDSKKTLNELCARLMVEETRTTAQESNDSAFMAKRSYGKKDYKKNFKSNKRGKCFRCGSESHWRKDCPVQSNGNPSSFEGHRSDALCCDIVGEACSALSERDAWIVDSGATEHMSGRREWFKNYHELKVPHSVRIGNGDKIQAVGAGDIDVLVYDGKHWKQKYLANVWYVPELFINLFSQGRCLDKGCVMYTTNEKCEFKRDSCVVAVGIRQTGLYKMLIRTRPIQTHACLAVKECLRSWHERFAHQNIAQVKQFLRRNNIEFVNEDDFQCEACIFGKHHRLPFENRIERSKNCGEVFHTDVCGPMQVTSIGGSQYFLLLKDDYSHYRFVYFLRHKSEVTGKIISFIRFVQTQTEHKVKIIRSDNGTEYVNGELKQFFEKNGIQHQLTVPYTPEQNGSSERDNRTIVEAARTMIHSSNLCLSLWAEAVNSAVYVLNRTGTSTVKNKSPF